MNKPTHWLIDRTGERQAFTRCHDGVRTFFYARMSSHTVRVFDHQLAAWGWRVQPITKTDRLDLVL